MRPTGLWDKQSYVMAEERCGEIGLGLFSLHGAALESALKAALESGYTLFDTAYKYGNEQEIGTILPPSSLVCTKICGTQYTGRRRFLHLDRQSIRKSVSQAARKLKRNPIDIVLLHNVFRGYPEAFAELVEVQREGRVKTTGVSGYAIRHLEEIKRHCGVYPQVCMLELHPYHSSPELTAYCAGNGIRVMARSPFAHGLILQELGREPVFQELAASTGKSVPQLVLRWCIQHGWTPIPRSADVRHIRENIAVFDFELSAGEMQAIDALNRDQSYGVFIKK